MSPLWRDEIGIYLAPHKLALTRLARGVRPKSVGEANWSNELEGDVHWGNALNALSALRSVGTPRSSAERAFLPVALSCKPQRVPRSASTTAATAAAVMMSASRLTGKSPDIFGSSAGSGNGGVDCALPPSGGCHGPEIR